MDEEQLQLLGNHQSVTMFASINVSQCTVLCSGCTFGTCTHEEKLLPALQRAHVAHPFLCSQGGLGDRGDLGDLGDQRVQPGLGHPDETKTKEKRMRGGKQKDLFNNGKAKQYFQADISLGLPSVICLSSLVQVKELAETSTILQ